MTSGLRHAQDRLGRRRAARCRLFLAHSVARSPPCSTSAAGAARGGSGRAGAAGIRCAASPPHLRSLAIMLCERNSVRVVVTRALVVLIDGTGTSVQPGRFLFRAAERVAARSRLARTEVRDVSPVTCCGGKRAPAMILNETPCPTTTARTSPRTGTDIEGQSFVIAKSSKALAMIERLDAALRSKSQRDGRGRRR